MNRTRIVILGAGFGGAYCAQELERKLSHQEVEITLIDEHNYFIFYPLLAEAGTGSLEPRHAVVPIRSFLRSHIFRMARVVDIDLLGQQVIYQQAELNKKEIIQYDHLVIALGSVTQMPAIPGLREHGFTMKDLGDAIALRDRAIEMLEVADSTSDELTRRRLLHFVVVGGSFTGIEVAGEFEFFFRQGTQFYRGIGSNDYKISVVELTDRILPALEAGLADYAQKKLESRNVEFFLQNRVSAVDLNRVFLENGQVLEARTLIWAAGIAPNPLLSCLDVPCDKRGYILCSPDLRVSGQENVWAIGDCAVNPGPDGQAYPATAQHAVRQGKWLAKNLIRVLGGRDTTPCEIVTRGSLAALGCRTGVAEIFGLRLSGFPAWFLWRAVYLFKMPTFSRKLRIALDWTVDLLFSRDFVELGLHRGRQSGEAK
jgi:NADH dehydrogenase